MTTAGTSRLVALTIGRAGTTRRRGTTTGVTTADTMTAATTTGRLRTTTVAVAHRRPAMTSAHTTIVAMMTAGVSRHVVMSAGTTRATPVAKTLGLMTELRRREGEWTSRQGPRTLATEQLVAGDARRMPSDATAQGAHLGYCPYHGASPPAVRLEWSRPLDLATPVSAARVWTTCSGGIVVCSFVWWSRGGTAGGAIATAPFLKSTGWFKTRLVLSMGLGHVRL